MTSGVDIIERNSIPEPNTGCWLWMLGGSGPYGRVHYRGGSETTHTLSYKSYKGPIPLGMVVRHKCNVGICVNPDHLVLGTQYDNVRDMVRCGATNSPANRKAKAAKRVLSNAIIDTLRFLEAEGLGYKQVAVELKISERQARSYMHKSQAHYYFRRPR